MIHDPNTVLVGLLQDGKRCAALTKLRKDSGALEEIAENVGDDPWLVLAEILQDIKPVKAKQCIIFSNAGLDMKRIPKEKPSETRWVRKGKMWFLVFSEKEMVDWQRAHAGKFIVLRQLFQFDRWRYVEVGPDQLSTTRRLLDEEHR